MTSFVYCSKNKTTQEESVKSNLFWNRFDKIVCIHYLPYTERFENIKSELKRVGILDLPQFEFYYTIDNDFYRYILDGIPKEKIDSKKVNVANIKYTIDSFTLLKKLQFHGYKHILILEDDIAFHKNLEFVRSIVESTPNDYDVMNYDPEIIRDNIGNMIGDFKTVNKNVMKYGKDAKIINMSCCALSSRMISYIVQKQLKQLQPFDIYTWLDVSGFNTYCVKNAKNICIQDMLTYGTRQTERTIFEKYIKYGINVYDYVSNIDKVQHKMEIDDVKVIVSLTSYPHRFCQPDFLRCLKSLVEQNTSIKYKIVLTLYENDIDKIPKETRKYIDEHNIEVISCSKDIMQHKKYFYVMQKYSSFPIITVDDDVVYQPYLVGCLYWTHQRNLGYVVCGRCDRMMRDQNGHILPMDNWKLMVNVTSCQDEDLFGIGVGGILYPSIVCQQINKQFLKFVEKVKSDDCLMFMLSKSLGLKYMTVSTNCRYRRTGGMGFLGKEPLACGRDEKALWIVNKKNNYKDMYIKCFEDIEHGKSLKETIG